MTCEKYFLKEYYFLLKNTILVNNFSNFSYHKLESENFVLARQRSINIILRQLYFKTKLLYENQILICNEQDCNIEAMTHVKDIHC